MYERYKKLLDEKGLKNSDVSRGAKVSNMTLSDWKNGKTVPKTDTLRKIAEFLNVSVDYLLGNDNKSADCIIKNEDMELFIEVMKRTDSYDRLIAYARKLIELNNMEDV